MSSIPKYVLCVILTASLTKAACAQTEQHDSGSIVATRQVDRDPSQVKSRLPVDAEAYPAIAQLPDLFTFNDNHPVKSVGDWRRRRRELIELLMFYQYGRIKDAAHLRLV